MRCEVCGRKIHGAAVNAVIEGAKLTVCSACAKYGKTVTTDEDKSTISASKPALPTHLTRKKAARTTVEADREVVDGYDALIRRAREKLGLSHEELARKINEKESVLKKLEAGKMKPDNMLASKLEHALKIKLLTPVVEEEPKGEILKAQAQKTTLGDIVRLNREKGEE